MKKTSFGLLAALAALAAAPQAHAQMRIPLAVEVRGGAGFPTGDFGDMVKTGYGFGVNGQFNVTPVIGVYAGYNRFEFDREGTVADVADAKAIDSGLNAGVQATFAPMMGFAGAAPFLRGGAVYHRVNFATDGGDSKTDYGLGFEVGGGLDVPLGPTVSLTPGVRYIRYTPEFGGTKLDRDINYVAADVGLKIRL